MITDQNTHTPIGTLAGIIRSAEHVTLDLLEAIDDTVASLGGFARVISGLESMMVGATANVAALQPQQDCYLDQDDVVISHLDQAIQSFNHHLTRMVNKRASINLDDRLQPHHGDALHDAYDEAITATAALLEALHSARSAIIAHDLAAEPRSTPHTTADELIAALHN